MDIKRKFALKCIKIENLEREQRYQTEHEVYVLEDLICPNIIRHYDHFIHDGCLYMAIEHTSQGTLEKVI